MATQHVATVNNPYGITGTWEHGGIIIQFVMLLLLFMSLISWYVILTKLWDQRKLRQAARQAEKQFWAAPSIKEGVEKLKKDNDFRAIAEDGLRAMSHHDGRLTDRIDLPGVTDTLLAEIEQEVRSGDLATSDPRRTRRGAAEART